MNLVQYYDLPGHKKQRFVDFLKQASQETDSPAHVNMWCQDWHHTPCTLLYQLEKTDQFRQTGAFYVLYDQHTIVGCSGAYTSDFSADVAVLGVRTWITPGHRNKSIPRNYFLPAQKAWAISQGHKSIILTFNDYNKNIMQLWNRVRLGENRGPRGPHHFGSNGTHVVPFPVSVKFTKQYVLYEKIDNNWDYDWQQIKW